MRTPRIEPNIPPEEYDAFLALLKEDHDFPTTYGEWFKSTTEERKKYEAHGEKVRSVTIHAQEFSDWCRGSGLDPSLDILRAFASKKPYRKR